MNVHNRHPNLLEIAFSLDFGDISIALKMAQFRKSTGPRSVNWILRKQISLHKTQNFSLKKMHLKISSAKWRPFLFRGDELKGKAGTYILRNRQIMVEVIIIIMIFTYIIISSDINENHNHNYAAILSIRTQGIYFREILFELRKFSFEKMFLKMSFAKCRPFCLRLNVLWGDIFQQRILAEPVSGFHSHKTMEYNSSSVP